MGVHVAVLAVVPDNYRIAPTSCMDNTQQNPEQQPHHSSKEPSAALAFDLPSRSSARGVVLTIGQSLSCHQTTPEML